jgi:hypothetical protein
MNDRASLNSSINRLIWTIKNYYIFLIRRPINQQLSTSGNSFSWSTESIDWSYQQVNFKCFSRVYIELLLILRELHNTKMNVNWIYFVQNVLKTNAWKMIKSYLNIFYLDLQSVLIKFEIKLLHGDNWSFLMSKITKTVEWLFSCESS